MKSYTPKEIVAILIVHGFELIRSKGSHQIFLNKITGKRTVVPMHAKDLKKGLCTEYSSRRVSTLKK